MQIEHSFKNRTFYKKYNAAYMTRSLTLFIEPNRLTDSYYLF